MDSGPHTTSDWLQEAKSQYLRAQAEGGFDSALDHALLSVAAGLIAQQLSRSERLPLPSGSGSQGVAAKAPGDARGIAFYEVGQELASGVTLDELGFSERSALLATIAQIQGLGQEEPGTAPAEEAEEGAMRVGFAQPSLYAPSSLSFDELMQLADHEAAEPPLETSEDPEAPEAPPLFDPDFEDLPPQEPVESPAEDAPGGPAQEAALFTVAPAAEAEAFPEELPQLQEGEVRVEPEEFDGALVAEGYPIEDDEDEGPLEPALFEDVKALDELEGADLEGPTEEEAEELQATGEDPDSDYLAEELAEGKDPLEAAPTSGGGGSPVAAWGIFPEEGIL